MVHQYEGRLEIQVVAGRELPKRGLFGRQDSAVELSLGTSKKRTQVDKKGGANPEWNDHVIFTVAGLGKTQLLVRAIEVESSVSSKDIGSCVIDLVRIFEEEEVDGWYALKFKEKAAGDVYLEFTFTPKTGRKRLHVEPPREDDDDVRLQVAPKVGNFSAATASAPSLPPAPYVGMTMARPQSAIVGLSGSQTVPAGGLAALGNRPSTSDMRPYSSASMYNPELAIKYANKHGKKPLPAAPSPATMSMGFDNSGGIPPASQHLPQQGYDQTMMPGQFFQANQQQQYAHPPLLPPLLQGQQQYQHSPQQQQQTLPYGNGMRPVSLDSGIAMGTMLPQNQQLSQQLSQYQQQQQMYQPQQQQQQQPQYQQYQQYQQQEPPLMNLFAPPPGTESSPQSKILPNPPPQSVTPTFTPAYNPAFANNASQPQQAQPGKNLPAPPPASQSMGNAAESQSQYNNQGYVMEQQPPGNYMYQSMSDNVHDMAYSQQQQQQQQQQQMIYGSMGPSSMSQPYSQQQPQQMMAYQQQMAYPGEYPMNQQMNQQMMHPQSGYAMDQMGMSMEPSAPMVAYSNPQGQYMSQQQYQQQQQQQQMYAPGNAYGNQSYQ
ncbi:hypothetical protein GGI01_000136 [Coemansia sp. RSA 376]|nr:hypothetical protein GGI01_000136 [Coemansia sp. RSA 376]